MFSKKLYFVAWSGDLTRSVTERRRYLERMGKKIQLTSNHLIVKILLRKASTLFYSHVKLNLLSHRKQCSNASIAKFILLSSSQILAYCQLCEHKTEHFNLGNILHNRQVGLPSTIISQDELLQWEERS